MNKLLNKGFSIPLILILVIVLAGLPVIFWAFTNDVNTSSSSEAVRGIASKSGSYAKPGFGIIVISNSETWDLVEYLCKTLEECISSLESGKRWGIVSGGKTLQHEILVEASDDWKNYEYIKYYVRPGWASSENVFNVLHVGEVPGSTVHKIEDNGKTYEAVVSPISELISSYYRSATFSDN